MRVICLIGLLALAPAVVAQQQARQQTGPTRETASPANRTEQTDQRYSDSGDNGSSAKAPALGHPLDSRDVDILTGKANRESREPIAYPYGYGYGGMYGADLAGSRWRGRADRGLLHPFLRSGGMFPFRSFHRPGRFFFFGW